MKFIETSIPGLLIIKPSVFSDERGFFFESFQAQRFADAGIEDNFVQDNHSGSSRGTLRGLHYQIQHAQGKLVRVISGKVFDVAVDMRKSKPTFGQWEGIYLSSENKLQVWISPGFAHGFYVMSDWAEVVYKTTAYYAPQHERTLLWCDPKIGIDWPIIEDQQPTLSKKDKQGKLFDDAETFSNRLMISGE